MADLLEVTIKIPLAESDATGGYRIDVDLGVNNGRSFNRLREALDKRGDRLKHGRRVQSNSQVVRWLSERIDDAIKEAEKRGGQTASE